MFDRNLARLIRNEISHYNLQTTYRVGDDGKLYVMVPGGLRPEQRELVMRHRDELIQLFTTPPQIEGWCTRGHEVEWALTKFGVWLCQCYWSPDANEQPEIKIRSERQPKRLIS